MFSECRQDLSVVFLEILIQDPVGVAMLVVDPDSPIG